MYQNFGCEKKTQNRKNIHLFFLKKQFIFFPLFRANFFANKLKRMVLFSIIVLYKLLKKLFFIQEYKHQNGQAFI